ncbi:hypothetical protein D9615_010491 [Tricholomella constricta]|uniref:Aspartate kinase n=1 Tax=Tricholomella constricta TaxID=117010 RepID=A0A8H5GN73_9AGAR|nr:hypothetical protein D9615_010491 [Tricholomella constricta]
MMRESPGVRLAHARTGEKDGLSSFSPLSKRPPSLSLSLSPPRSALFSKAQASDSPDHANHSLLTSSSTAVNSPSTYIPEKNLDIEESTPSFVVLKFGGTSVAKHLPSIVDTIVPYVPNIPSPTHAPALTPVYPPHRSQHVPNKRIPILVCSAQSYTVKSEGTTQRLLAAIDAAMPSSSDSDFNADVSVNASSPDHALETPPPTPPHDGSPTSRSASTPLPPFDEKEKGNQNDRVRGERTRPPAPKDIVDGIFARHCAGARSVVTGEELLGRLQDDLRKDCERVVDVLKAVQTLGEISPRTRDAVVSVGELMACRTVVAALQSRDIPARLVNLTNLNTNLDSAAPSKQPLDSLAPAIKARILEGLRSSPSRPSGPTPVLVATGFFGPIPGSSSLLDHIGRGYTDVCAALCARAVGAQELQIWKEVDGVFSADPRKIPTARLLTEISADQAKLLTSYGSEVVHHRAIDQLQATLDHEERIPIPIIVKNVVNPHGTGTRIVTAAISPTPAPRAGAMTMKTRTRTKTRTRSRSRSRTVSTQLPDPEFHRGWEDSLAPPSPPPSAQPQSQVQGEEPPSGAFAVTVLEDLDLFRLRLHDPAGSGTGAGAGAACRALAVVMDVLGGLKNGNGSSGEGVDLVSASALGEVTFVLPREREREGTGMEKGMEMDAGGMWRDKLTGLASITVFPRMSYLQVVLPPHTARSPAVAQRIMGALARARVDVEMIVHGHGHGHGGTGQRGAGGIGFVLAGEVAGRAAGVVHDALLERFVDIKRDIAHMCRDEQQPRRRNSDESVPGLGGVVPLQLQLTPQAQPPLAPAPAPASAPAPAPAPVPMTQAQFVYEPEKALAHALPGPPSDFLESLDEASFFAPPPRTPLTRGPSASASTSTLVTCAPTPPSTSTPAVLLPGATKQERFLLTAADQAPGPRNERLDRVIRSKYEAGLLKPHNYVRGYARLARWMDSNVSQESKQQILQPLAVLRPKFRVRKTRAVAQSLRDLDLVFIEEAFERLLLDYDRVFAAMGVPACLWRRTGEIYKANKEFMRLVGVEGGWMREGRLCIYELMSEESAVNYWEKYGDVAFEAGQKAVLTSCVLRYKPRVGEGGGKGGEEGFVPCCFSFTIRRDPWGIPTMIVGNFIRVV